MLFRSYYLRERAQPSLSQQNLHTQHFELLANIMMCIDHYLEGLAQQKPVGIRPFDVGLRSVQQLQAA